MAPEVTRLTTDSSTGLLTHLFLYFSLTTCRAQRMGVTYCFSDSREVFSLPWDAHLASGSRCQSRAALNSSQWFY
jgi:hypothetical protein